MPITAYSKDAAREVDLEQWLTLNQYSIKDDPLLKRIPVELKDKAARDIECCGCRAYGAMLVAVGRQHGVGRSVSQGHFRFGAAVDANPHHPLCDFYCDEQAPRNADHLVNFASDRSTFTRVVRDLVCRGIRAGHFGQGDIRRMRLWFLDEKTAHAMPLDVTPELLNWCIDMDATRLARELPFQPEHGQMPGFNWAEAAKSEWRRRNAGLFEERPMRVHFRTETIERALKLIEPKGSATVLDPTVLREKYEAVVQLSEFAALYIFHLVGTKPKTYWRVDGLKSAGRGLQALCALLLFMNDWDIARASSAFARLTTLPPAADGTEGNVMGLNPFHDYESWQILHEAKRVAARRTDDRPVAEQIDAIKTEMHIAHREWLAKTIPHSDVL